MIDVTNNSNNMGLYNTNTHYIKREISTQNSIAAKHNEEQLHDFDDFQTKRQTYGLAILELMSDQEYQAWMRATAGMTEMEKILAVQKLYPLADIERLKNSKKNQSDDIQSQNAGQQSQIQSEGFIINANKLNGIKLFNTKSDFIQRYKNAFENININVDING